MEFILNLYKAILKLIESLMTALGADASKIPGYLFPEEAPEENTEA